MEFLLLWDLDGLGVDRTWFGKSKGLRIEIHMRTSKGAGYHVQWKYWVLACSMIILSGMLGVM
jgi:hypothetical protein